MPPRTSKLILPAALVVTTFVMTGACTSDPEDGASDSQADAPDDSSGDTAADTTDGGVTYCIELFDDMSACEAEADCVWSDEFNECVHICTLITTQVECEANDSCVWDPAGDNGGYCYEPFT
jgi:hypothetical protein